VTAQASLFATGRAVDATAVRYGRDVVPTEVVSDAMAALEHFNAATGRACRPFTERGKPSESLKRILGAMLDYPQARGLAPAMIDAALRDPWWSGPASTGVIFGPNVVERSIEQAERPSASIRGSGAILRALDASDPGGGNGVVA
jgi:hypothetical protein